MEIICYACGGGENPENTLKAIRHCQTINPNWRIEMDIQMTKDGALVLFHDEDTMRINGKHEKIETLNLTEVKQLNAGYNFKSKGQFIYRDHPIQIPTLEEVLHHFTDAKLLLDIHCKNTRLVPILIDLIEKNGAQDRVVIVSQYDVIIKMLKLQRPKWLYGAATNEAKKMIYSSFFYLDQYFTIQSDILMMPVQFWKLKVLSKRIIHHLKKQGKRIWVWMYEGEEVITITTSYQLKQLKNMAVDGVFTAFPERLNKKNKT